MIRVEDETRLNRCNSICKACKFVKRMMVLQYHLCLQKLFTYTLYTKSDYWRGVRQWDCCMTLGHM